MYELSIPAIKTMTTDVAIRLNEPLMVWGLSGIGKSEAVRQATEEVNGTLCDIRTSQYDSVDFRGIPSDRDNMTVWNMPATLPFKGNSNFIEDDKPIVLFLDEINAATQAVYAVCYQLVQERRIGEHVLMDNVRIIAAGNREQDRGVVNRMPMPLCGRFVHVEAGLDVDAWCNEMQRRNAPPVGIAFMQFRKPLLSTFSPTNLDKAVASPRTWEKALKLYNDDQLGEETKRAAMAGSVGDGPAAEFWGFVDVWKSIIPIDQIIANPTGVPTPEELSMLYAITVNVSGHINAKTAKPLNMFLARLSPEFIILAWQLALKRDDSLFNIPEFIKLATDYRAVFR